MMWNIKVIKLAFVITCLALFSLAYGDAAPQRFYGFEHFDHNKTLTSQSIVSVAQDKYGFLWFGTEDAGVFRFDGIKFNQYIHASDDPKSIAPGRVYGILADRHGYIWFATSGSGVSQYNPDTDTFKTFQHDTQQSTSLGNDIVRSFMEDHEGNIWMGTSNGISIFNYTSEQFSHIKVTSGVLPKGDVWHLFQDQFKHVWIGTYGGGLVEYNPIDKTIKHYQHNIHDAGSLAHNIVGAIIEDSNGNIWVGGKGGLNKLNRETGSFTHFKHDPNDSNSLLENYVWDLHLDERGFLWVAGFGGGLARFDPNSHKVIRHSHDPNQSNSLSSNLVFFVFQDHSGVLWAGTSNGGLNKYVLASDHFESYLNHKSEKNSFLVTDIISLYQTRDKMIWLGGTDPKGGIVAWNLSENSTTHFPYKEDSITGIPNGEVYDFVEDQQGFLWFTGGVTAVKKLNRQTGEVTQYQHNSKDSNSILHDTATSLFVDALDNLWVCTMGGVSKLDRTRSHFTHYLKGTQCDTMFIDSKNNLWVGTPSEGIYVFNISQGDVINYRHDMSKQFSLSGDYVTHIYESEDQQIWLGTMGSGLNLWRPDSQDFIHYGIEDGLSDNSVSTILEGALGRLWITTSNGLSVFDKNNQTFTNFYVKDGLISNSFDNISDASSISGADGYLYFANSKGVVRLNPETVLASDNVPPVVITHVQIANKAAQLTSSYWHAKKIVLDWQDRMISFSFSVLDFSNPDQNKIAYMLEGFDNDWIESGSQRRAVYTNLDGGDYVFKIKASNNHGVWSDDSLAIQVYVIPPWWETIYAIAAYILVVVFFIRWFIRVKIRNKQQELAVVSAMNKKLEFQVAERTAHLNVAIDDLHKNRKFMVQAEKMLSMGRLVTGIAHEVNTPLGVSVTAASALDEDVTHLKNKMAKNELSRSDFESRIMKMNEYTQLLVGSLGKAAKMIDKFKKISIDEIDEEFQVCNVLELIRDTQNSIDNEYAHRNIQWRINCDEKLLISSSHYAIYTLLENLASNAIKHGYDDYEECHISINVEYQSEHERVKILVEDNGKGIDKENIVKIFDPFYTSARGSNCTGLGLHIVYNEVTHRLRGTIECLSHEGSGCQFITEFSALRILKK